MINASSNTMEAFSRNKIEMLLPISNADTYATYSLKGAKGYIRVHSYYLYYQLRIR